MKTCSGLRIQVYRALGSGDVVHHEPTEENQIGQSGVHTFVDDIMDVVFKAMDLGDTVDGETEHNVFRELSKFFHMV
jgi:hypothetical protein